MDRVGEGKRNGVSLSLHRQIFVFFDPYPHFFPVNNKPVARRYVIFTAGLLQNDCKPTGFGETHMIASISTELGCTEDELWSRLIQPKVLQFLANPVLSFIPCDGSDFEKEWTVGKKYRMKLYLLKLLPLGMHQIELIVMDKLKNQIVARESDRIARVWNHTIRFKTIGKNRLHYTDEIEIRAGLFTPVLWVFAHIFYRHRQRRWGKLMTTRKIPQGNS